MSNAETIEVGYSPIEDVLGAHHKYIIYTDKDSERTNTTFIKYQEQQ